MQTHTDFIRSLTKGKIAETLFRAMISESERYTVIPSGYEHTLPILTQAGRNYLTQKSLETVRKSPDFLLVSQDKKEVVFVEVKYRSVYVPQELQQTAEEINKNWDAVWIFLATPAAFYLSSCQDIVAEGHMRELDILLISKDLQRTYLGILNEFIKPS